MQNDWKSLKSAFLADLSTSHNGNFYSKNTIRAYSIAIDKLIAFLNKKEVYSIEFVDIGFIAYFLGQLSDNGLSSTTIKLYQSAIAYFLDFCIDHHEKQEKRPLIVNPVTQYILKEKAKRKRMARPIARLPPVLYANEEKILFDRILAHEFKQASTSDFIRLRDAAMIGLCLDSGLRTSELVALTLSQIRHYLSDHMLRVIGKGNKERVIKPLDDYREFLTDYLDHACRAKHSTDLLFTTIRNTIITQSSFYKSVDKYLTISGIEKPQMGGHLLRHTCASKMLSRGLNIKQVQQNLGHSSIVVTEKYLHLL
jgi:site-specific recombinase XerD